MKNTIKISLLIFILEAYSCKTNSSTSKEVVSKEDTVAQFKPPCALPLTPEYPGGNEALKIFINEHLKYPEEAKKNNISGPVLVSFTVLVSGEITNIKVQQGLGYGCDEEAVRILKLMPKWIPGKYLNESIDMEYSIGILFENK